MRDDPISRLLLPSRHALARIWPAALILLGSCTGAAGVSDDANIDELPRLMMREELRIGSAHDPDTGFTRIGPITVDDMGNVYVAERGEQQVRVYDPEGRRIRVIGREGDGPGEFRSLNRMGLIGDTLWVGDEGNKRVTLFSLDGSVLATFRAPEHVSYPEPRWRFYLVGTTYRGKGQVASNLSMYSGRRDMSRTSVSVPRLVFDSAGTIVDTIGFQRVTFPTTLTRVTVGSRELAMPRVSDDTLSVDAEEGSFLVSRTMAATDAVSSFDVVRVGARADTIFSRTYRYRPAAFESWYLDTMAARFGDRYRSSTTVNAAAAERAARENVTLPAFQPPISSARASEDGGLWLRRDSDYHAMQRWIILDADGRPRGEVQLPANVTIKWTADDVVWLSIPDEQDVPWLVRYRIEARQRD